MSFGNWHWLFALFIPASMLVWIWLRDQFPTLGLGHDRRIALPQDYGVAANGRVWDFFVRCFMSAGPLMLAVAIILWAGPRHLDVPKAKRELTNIEFCLDLSGSMMARFGNGSRYDAAMEALNGFVTQREGDAFGLTVFGDNARTLDSTDDGSVRVPLRDAFPEPASPASGVRWRHDDWFRSEKMPGSPGDARNG